MIGPSQRPLPDNTRHPQEADIHGPRRDSNPLFHQASDRIPTPLKKRGHWDGQFTINNHAFNVLFNDTIDCEQNADLVQGELTRIVNWWHDTDR
jgi:hypothetical protein